MTKRVCENVKYLPYTKYTDQLIYINTAGKISIEHVTIFLSKYILKGSIDMKFSPDVGNNPSNPYMQRNQNKYFQK